jgi:hypothetical protein
MVPNQEDTVLSLARTEGSARNRLSLHLTVPLELAGSQTSPLLPTTTPTQPTPQGPSLQL